MAAAGSLQTLPFTVCIWSEVEVRSSNALHRDTRRVCYRVTRAIRQGTPIARRSSHLDRQLFGNVNVRRDLLRNAPRDLLLTDLGSVRRVQPHGVRRVQPQNVRRDRHLTDLIIMSVPHDRHGHRDRLGHRIRRRLVHRDRLGLIDRLRLSDQLLLRRLRNQLWR